MDLFIRHNKQHNYYSLNSYGGSLSVRRAYGNRDYYNDEIAKGNDYKGNQDLDIKLQRPPHNRYAIR